MACIHEQTAIDFAEDRLVGRAAAGVATHIRECDKCFELVKLCLELEDPADNARNVAKTTLRYTTGDVIDGKYVIQACIGEGAAGIIYRARPIAGGVEQAIALKVLRSASFSSAAALGRVMNEIEIGRALSPEHVCPVLDAGWTRGAPYLVLELAERSLRDELTHGRPRKTLGARLRDAQAVARGLQAIHRQGLMHRDLKPENVLRMCDGRLVISDFGLARSLAPTTNDENAQLTVGVGTPDYMAPELRRLPACQASDIYAFGVLLHELVFGSHPRERGFGDPARASYTAVELQLAKLCDSCLSPAPEQRPSIDVVLSRLRRVERLAAASTKPSWVVPFAAFGAVVVGVSALGLRYVPSLAPSEPLAPRVPTSVQAATETRKPPPSLPSSTATWSSPAPPPAPRPAPSASPPPAPPDIERNQTEARATRANYTVSYLVDSNRPAAPGFTLDHLKARRDQIAPKIEACYAPYRDSDENLVEARWSMSVDPDGRVSHIAPSTHDARSIPALDGCVTSVLRNELDLGPTWTRKAATVQLTVTASPSRRLLAHSPR